MNCPKCNTEWGLEKILNLYYEDHEDAEMELQNKIEVPIEGNYDTSVYIICPECENEFEIYTAFKKVKQEIKEVEE